MIACKASSFNFETNPPHQITLKRERPSKHRSLMLFFFINRMPQMEEHLDNPASTDKLRSREAPKRGKRRQKEEERGGQGRGSGIYFQAAGNKLAIGVKAWLVISKSGQSFVEEVGKHSIMKRTGLPARDLRALDPVLSYPSSILGRERAIVVNLEHIRAIITATEVLMINSNNPLIVQFVEDLQHRIAYGNATATPPQQAVAHDGNGSGDAADMTSPTYNSGDVKSKEITGENANSTMNDLVAAGPKVLPFEFRAIEACLESACRCLESETQKLEEEAYPALDELTSNISTLNLERVRQIKSRLVAISGRVQKVRDELEHLLDDDNDMAEMYLTEKLFAYAADQTSSIEEVYDGEQEVDDASVDDSKSRDDSDIYTSSKPNIEELEMLLEAYFAQIDGTLQKLSHMRDYVDDTEDFINIMLDDKQNQLLQMGVMLGASNMIINAGIVVVGLFGMNIHTAIFDGKPIQFLETVIGTCGGCVALFLVVLGWGKKKNILAI